jgi:tyrosine-protein kinase
VSVKSNSARENGSASSGGARTRVSSSSNGVGTVRVGLHSSENELQRVLGVLRRRWLPIAVAVLVVVGAAVALSVTQEKRYTASASILFRSQNLAQQLPGGSSASVDPATEAATNLELVSLERVAAQTAHRLGHGFNAREISDRVHVAAKGTSNGVDVRATWPSPRTAAAVATTFAQQFVQFQADTERQRVNAAEKRLRLTLERARALALPDHARIATIRANLDALDVLKSVSSGASQVIQRADVPGVPSSPKPLRNAMIGIFAGLLLGIVIAIALEQLDRRVRSATEFEELLGAPLLAQIPRSDGFVKGVSAPLPPPPLEAEFFNTLSTTVQLVEGGSGMRSLLVTSPTAELGKTTVSLNLALASARAGSRTLLLEVDLRRPNIAKRLGLESDRNLVGALTGGLPLADVVQTVEVPVSDSPEEEPAQLDVVVAGPPSQSAPRLVESDEMERLINEAEASYDLVIVDSPPAGLISDAVALLSMIEAAVVVCRIGTTTREQVLWLHTQLDQIHAKVLGVVANFAPVKIDQYYGAYRLQLSQKTAQAVRASAEHEA